MKMKLSLVSADIIRPLYTSILVLAMTLTIGCSSADGNGNESGGGGGGATTQANTIAGTSWESKSQMEINDAIYFYSDGTGTYSYAIPNGSFWTFAITNFTYTSSGSYVYLSPAIEGSTSFSYYGGNTITIGFKTFTKTADIGGGGGGGGGDGSGYIRIINNTSAHTINEVKITRNNVSVAYDYSYSSKVIYASKSYEVPVGQCVVNLRDIQASKTWTKTVTVAKNSTTDVSVYDSGWN